MCSTQAVIDTLIIEQWISFHLDTPKNGAYVNPGTDMPCLIAIVRKSLHCAGSLSPSLVTPCSKTCKAPGEVAALGIQQLKTSTSKWGYWHDRSVKYRSPWPKGKTLVNAALWRTGDKEAPPTSQTLAVRRQLQGHHPQASSITTFSQGPLTGGQVAILSKEDDKGTKYMVTTCRIATIDDMPATRFMDLKNPLWVVIADLLDGCDLGALVPHWLFDVVMSGKDVMFYGDTDLATAIGKDLQKYSRDQKAKDPKALACHRLSCLFSRGRVHGWLPTSIFSTLRPC